MEGNRGTAIVGIGATFIAIGTILTGLRVFTRIRLVAAGLGWDDAFIVIALVSKHLSQMPNPILTEGRGACHRRLWFMCQASTIRPGPACRLPVASGDHQRRQIPIYLRGTPSPFDPFFQGLYLLFPSTPIRNQHQLALDLVRHHWPHHRGQCCLRNNNLDSV